MSSVLGAGSIERCLDYPNRKETGRVSKSVRRTVRIQRFCWTHGPGKRGNGFFKTVKTHSDRVRGRRCLQNSIRRASAADRDVRMAGMARPGGAAEDEILFEYFIQTS